MALSEMSVILTKKKIIPKTALRNISRFSKSRRMTPTQKEIRSFYISEIDFTKILNEIDDFESMKDFYYYEVFLTRGINYE